LRKDILNQIENIEKKNRLRHSSKNRETLNYDHHSFGQRNFLSRPSGKLPIECQKTAKNLTFFSKKLTKIFIFSKKLPLRRVRCQPGPMCTLWPPGWVATWLVLTEHSGISSNWPDTQVMVFLTIHYIRMFITFRRLFVRFLYNNPVQCRR